MAKGGPRVKGLLRSVEWTGTTYAATKNRRTTVAELEFRKDDERLRRHVIFRETKA